MLCNITTRKEQSMKSGTEIIKEAFTDNNNTFWDYAWLALVPVAVIAWSILAAII
jgi:hypothetical protein